MRAMPSIIAAGGAAPATIALTLCVDAGAHRLGRGDKQVVDDRRGAVVVDALAADRIEDRLRLDLAQADVRAAEQRHGPGKHQPLQWNIGSVHR